MPGLFIKLEVGFWDDPKIQAAGEQAAVLYIHMLCYCKANLTDGFVPDTQLPRFGLRAVGKRAEKLAGVGLIVRDSRRDSDAIVSHSRRDSVAVVSPSCREGWQIVSWLSHNRSRTEVNEIRKERRSAGSKGGKAKAAAASKRLANCQDFATTETYPEYRVQSTETELATTSTVTPSAPAPAPADDGDLPAKLLDLCGMAEGTKPTKGERATVANLLRKGYTPEHLEARAARASLADMNPRALLMALLTEDLNQPPPAPPTTSGPTPTRHREPTADIVARTYRPYQPEPEPDPLALTRELEERFGKPHDQLARLAEPI